MMTNVQISLKVSIFYIPSFLCIECFFCSHVYSDMHACSKLLNTVF